MILNHLLQNVQILDTHGDLAVEVGHIRFDCHHHDPVKRASTTHPRLHIRQADR